MKLKILVLACKVMKFSGKDENTIEGVKVHYGVEGKNSEDSRGIFPVGSFLRGSGAKDQVKDVPGFYTGEFEVGIKDNKPDLKLIGLSFDGPANISFGKA